MAKLTSLLLTIIFVIQGFCSFSQDETIMDYSHKHKDLKFDWEPQPEKVALMAVVAHADDEFIHFSGVLPYYSKVKKLPALFILMTTQIGTWKGHPVNRTEDQQCACWDYGMKNLPIIAPFEDCCYKESLTKNYEVWGGRENVQGYLVAQIRKYKPDVIVTSALDGDYGHPNHMMCPLNLIEAFDKAGDPEIFPEQLDSLEVWQPKKLYIPRYPAYEEAWAHEWKKYPELDNMTPVEYANEVGYKCYKAHGQRRRAVEGIKYGLYSTTVGQDSLKNDFFENIDLSIYKVLH